MSKSFLEYSSLTSPDNVRASIIRCPYSKCNARIIKPTKDQELETIKIESVEFLKPSESTPESSNSDFLKVGDAWDFDNIGVSREFTVDREEEKYIQRLLICADCERGPLGFARFGADEKNKDVQNLKYYLHLNSVVFDQIE